MDTFGTAVAVVGSDVRLDGVDSSDGLRVGVANRGDRWIARVRLHGTTRVGIGPTARAAVAAGLAPLGPRVAAACLADPAMIGLSGDLATLEHRVAARDSNR